ncbi:MAG: LEPR-XLL domain-containing protein [Phycisphaerae bacterium]
MTRRTVALGSAEAYPRAALAFCAARSARIEDKSACELAACAWSPPCLEALEPRLLLSTAEIAAPNFILAYPAGNAAPASSTSPVGLTPSIIRRAYGFDQVFFGSIAGDGTGQTIAIIDAYNAPTIVSDLAAFDAAFGLPAPPSFTIVNQNGGSTLPKNAPGRGNSWAIETSLDVEWAHAIAPGASILLVEAKSAYLSDLFTAVDTARNWPGVSVISMSFGATESSYSSSSYDYHFTTPSGHAGVTFVASSGDTGGGDIEYPAVSVNVVAVGGTRLVTDAIGNYISETGWSYSSGGISSYTSQPAYQNGVVTQSSTRRTVPDVALDGDPNTGVAVYDSYDFKNAPWVQVGGTSLSAPMWAGLIAIANQGRVVAGQAVLDGPSQTLPAIYSLPSAATRDVVGGSNGAYQAVTGYDLVTGIGTPVSNLTGLDLTAMGLPGDADANGLVDMADYVIWFANFGNTGMKWVQGDFTGDGLVDMSDYIVWFNYFGQTLGGPVAAGPAIAVSQPATAGEADQPARSYDVRGAFDDGVLDVLAGVRKITGGAWAAGVGSAIAARPRPQNAASLGPVMDLLDVREGALCFENFTLPTWR